MKNWDDWQWHLIEVELRKEKMCKSPELAILFTPISQDYQNTKCALY